MQLWYSEINSVVVVVIVDGFYYDVDQVWVGGSFNFTLHTTEATKW